MCHAKEDSTQQTLRSTKDRENWRENSPLGLLRYAKEFLAVGQDSLEKHWERDPPSLLEQAEGDIAPDAIYYNFLHAVELGLKAYLRHTDAVPLEQLRSKKFGHDLSRLLRKACNVGLLEHCPTFDTRHIQVVCCASELYKSKRFEYIHIGFVSYPPIDQVDEAAAALLSGLGKLQMQPAQAPEQGATDPRRESCA